MAAHRLGKLAAWALIFLAAGRAAVAAAPLLRHYLVAVLNDPKDCGPSKPISLVARVWARDGPARLPLARKPLSSDEHPCSRLSETVCRGRLARVPLRRCCSS